MKYDGPVAGFALRASTCALRATADKTVDKSAPGKAGQYVRPQRTRSHPGPLLVTALVWMSLTGALRAHDPGLSSLDVLVSGERISVLLSMAASDVVLVAAGGEADVRLNLSELARDAVRLSIGGEALLAEMDDVFIDDDGGGRVRLVFRIPHLRTQAREAVRHLALSSDVPARVARGHRELLRVTLDDRVVAERLLDAESGPVTIDFEAGLPSAAGTASRFLGLGVRHILSGYDHLVFLAGLLLASRTVRELVTALTAFTAAHSVTLALAALGAVHIPPSIVEPLIAASIAWVGLESLLRAKQGARWLVVFGFGLIHGFGFGEALIDLGFGSSATEVALALASFNVGVEAGQLAVAAAMLPLVWTMRSRPAWNARLVPVCSMMIVVAGGYWLIERLH